MRRLPWGTINAKTAPVDAAVGDEVPLWLNEKVFSLDPMEVNTKPIAEGSMVVASLDESRTVIDLKAQ